MNWSMGNVQILEQEGEEGRPAPEAEKSVECIEVREECREHGAHPSTERGAKCTHMREPEGGRLGDHTDRPR
eukprot:12126495-Heterocapsa_arctica.AAC.1